MAGNLAGGGRLFVWNLVRGLEREGRFDQPVVSERRSVGGRTDEYHMAWGQLRCVECFLKALKIPSLSVDGRAGGRTGRRADGRAVGLAGWRTAGRAVGRAD